VPAGPQDTGVLAQHQTCFSSRDDVDKRDDVEHHVCQHHVLTRDDVEIAP
jgi:hypothetical protein